MLPIARWPRRSRPSSWLLGGARLRREGSQAALTSQLAGNELVYQLAAALAKPHALAELPEIIAERLDRPVPEAEILA